MMDALTDRHFDLSVLDGGVAGLAQWAGYAIGKGIAAAGEGTVAIACLKTLDAQVQRTQEAKGFGSQYNAGYLGLRPPGLEESIDGNAVVSTINATRPGEYDALDELDEVLLVEWRLMNTWELVGLTFTVGDQTDHAQVHGGFYIVDIGADGELTQAMMQSDGEWATLDGRWTYEHSGHVLTLAPHDEPPFVSTIISITFEEFVIVNYDEESEVTQTMTFAPVSK
jgi:hypothetical protein